MYLAIINVLKTVKVYLIVNSERHTQREWITN